MEENKNEKLQIQASTKSQSWMNTVGKDLFDNYIAPKTTEIMHNTFAGLISMMADTAQAGLDNEFKKRGWKGITKTTSNTPYNTMFTTTTTTSSGSRIINLNDRASNKVKLIFVKNEEDAIRLINSLKEDIAHYKRARVGDLYERLTPRIPSTFVDMTWGWVNGDQLGYRRIFTSEYGEEHRGDYLLELPDPVNITKL